MTIKIAGKSDVEGIYELNALFENDNTKDKIKKNIESAGEIVCIAYEGDKAVGFCVGLIVKTICYKNCRLDIETLFIKEAYRNKGIGKKLLQFMEKTALAKGITHFHLVTQQNNQAVRSFYEKIGYKNTGEILLDKTLAP